jgi:hypothetical protein
MGIVKSEQAKGLTLEKMMMMMITYTQQSFITIQYFLSESRNSPRFMQTEG